MGPQYLLKVEVDSKTKTACSLTQVHQSLHEQAGEKNPVVVLFHGGTVWPLLSKEVLNALECTRPLLFFLPEMN
jgi:hypothetical protein